MASDGPDQGSQMNSLAGRVALGAAWIVAGRFLMRAMGFVNLAIVARILTPEDYHYIAVVFPVLLVLQGMTEFGAAAAVVKFQDASKEDYNTIFSLSLLRGVLLAAILLALALPLANFYDDPAYIPLFCVIAIVPFIEGLYNPRFFEFERNLDFVQELKVMSANKLLAVIVSVVVALITRSYWALIAGHVTGTVVQLILTYKMVKFRPRFSLSTYKKVLGFSGWVAAVGFVNSINLKMDSLFLAKIFGKSDVGSYWMGVQLAQLPTNEIANPVGRALFPGMAGLQDDQAALRRACLAGAQGMGTIAAPMAFGMAFVAEDLVHLLLGDNEKWSMVIPVVQWVTPALGLYFITSPVYQFVMAQGKTKILFIRELIYFLFRVPLFIWAAIEYGFIGAVYMRAAAGLIQMGLNMSIYAHVAKRPFWELPAVSWRALVALAAMSVWFLLVRPYLGFMTPLPELVRLLLDVTLGGLVYAGTLLLVWRLAGYPAGVEQILVDRVRSLLAKFAP
ncbi:MAG: lipopolysaccharide biosynthesis protein [Parvularculaceae bacterium]